MRGHSYALIGKPKNNMKEFFGFKFKEDVIWASINPDEDGLIVIRYERIGDKMSKVKCLECGAILESKFRHDFQMCDCPQQTFVDGGNDYCRVGGMDLDKIEVLKDDTKFTKNKS